MLSPEPPIYNLRKDILASLRSNNVAILEEELFLGVHTFTDEMGVWYMAEETIENINKFLSKPKEQEISDPS